jgi:hypothetical protein
MGASRMTAPTVRRLPSAEPTGASQLGQQNVRMPSHSEGPEVGVFGSMRQRANGADYTPAVIPFYPRP